MGTPDKRPIPELKWIGLILGTLASLFWFLILVLRAVEDIAKSTPPPPMEGVLLSLFILLACASVGISWKYIQIGGILTAISGIALAIFAVFTAGHNRLIAALISGFPFLLAGLFINLSIWLKKGQG